MLKVYGWKPCPHCHKAVDWLSENSVPFEYIEVEEQSEELVQKIIDVNGGDDWVVPTLEYNGQWQAGRAFNAQEFEALLREWKIIK